MSKFELAMSMIQDFPESIARFKSVEPEIPVTSIILRDYVDLCDNEELFDETDTVSMIDILDNLMRWLP